MRAVSSGLGGLNARKTERLGRCKSVGCERLTLRSNDLRAAAEISLPAGVFAGFVRSEFAVDPKESCAVTEAATEPRRPTVERWVAHVEDVAVWLAGATLAAIMVVIVLDVFLRYLFNSPLLWVYEFVANYMIPFAFFLALAQTMRRGEMIRVDFFGRLVPRTTKWLLYLVALLASLLIFAVLTYISTREALSAFVAGENSVGYYVWPIWVSKAFVAVGVLLLTVRLAVQLAVDTARGPDADPDMRD